ncbi:MAG: NUDIX hydrolase [Anaerovoracaceae bacterium]|nr:NUDIX hydrolase [Anaerovoracaceae bacterium]
MEPFEEKTLETKRIYEPRVINLRKDKVTVRGGRTSWREIVENNGGAVAVAVTEDKKIIMVRQFRKPFDRVMTEVPAGKIEPGEDPDSTVRRELKEETGYTAENYELLSVMYPSVGYTTEKLYIYLCTGLDAGETDFDYNESIEIHKVDFKEIYDKVLAGEIHDGKTIAGVLLAAPRVI